MLILILKCHHQNVPEFETGFYLASYKCVCRANYEFPFIDYGSSYFEGATVEKEYDKKMKGLPNIFDRLKCRQFVEKNGQRREYINSSITTKNTMIKSMFFVTVIAWKMFYLV